MVILTDIYIALIRRKGRSCMHVLLDEMKIRDTPSSLRHGDVIGKRYGTHRSAFSCNLMTQDREPVDETMNSECEP